ncbi:MAG: hypothetical protein EOP56_05065 [Sphingobacteriales bacterium]|nr:MAG: hypothetical protein EOP56_05065 [Sphingobacteriales bacterium]
MPVKISANPAGEPDKRAITQDEYDQGRTNFNEHYTSAQTGEVQGQIIPVSWAAFTNMINSYIATYPAEVNAGNIAVSFIHCYDTLEEILYYRVKLSVLQPTEDPSVFNLVGPFMWQTIREHNIAPCVHQSSEDIQYMNNILYLQGPEADVQQLSENPGIFVRSMTLPWQNEILQMYVDNGSPMNATLNLASCTYLDGGTGEALVEWPHGIVLYLSVGGTDLLNNEDYILPFNHKGADLSTVCPPICHEYIVPVGVSNPANTSA